MWRQGWRCYQQLSVQQGYKNQWPVMTRKISNVGRNHKGASDPRCHDHKMQEPKCHRSSKWKSCRFFRNGRPWKRKGDYWKRQRSQKKMQARHCHSTGHQRHSRFCRLCQSHHRHYSRKRYFRRQRLLAFMCAAIKGRLRPMNLCGWRAPGMRAPRNTTQFIMHQVYEDMRQEKKRAEAAAAEKREEEDAEVQLAMEDNDSNMGSASASCMATILAMTPERNTLEGDEEVGQDVSSQKSQTYDNVDMECLLSISCEP